MKISEAKQAYRLKERVQLVQEQRESGLTIKAWCAANNVKESSFYYWLREVRKAALQANEATNPKVEQALVRIDVPVSMALNLENVIPSSIRMHYKDAVIDIPSGARTEDLTMVLNVLDDR